ncbi:MAG: phosphotransferase enzyme family protein [Pseudonocardiaceae bacterium]
MSANTAHDPDRYRVNQAQTREHDFAPDSPSLLSAVSRACAARGLDAGGMRLLHHYSNAVVLLPLEGAVARVATTLHDIAQIKRSQDVTRWLVEEHGFPATQPLPGSKLVELDASATVSFWVYYPQPSPPKPLASAHMGRLLADLHAISQPPHDLPRWVPLDSLNHALHDDTVALVLDDTDRDWLRQRIAEVREELATLDWPLGQGLIHGDAWAGNLLWTPNTTEKRNGVLLGDWDRVSHGPREVDLIPTWHATHRYGKGPSWTSDFIRHYGHDLTGWSGLPALLAMRDLGQISGPLRRAPHSPPHAHALRQRVDGLRAGDTSTIWTAL